MILSEIEQCIKAKIEKIGTPLKEWNVNIYRGILTGYNDAFIIDKAKKEEILANCQSDEERKKTDELIRPILRGRDIKRYGYDFADLYLINTHNGVKEKGIKRIHIEDYPAVKAHLDWYYPQLEKRADKGDTPYNLRNCAYIEDFYKQKIVYPNMTKFMPFFLDNENFLVNQKCFIMTGEKLAYLTAFLNSNIFKICYRDNFPELQGGTRELSKIFFEQIKIPFLKEMTEQEILSLIANESYKKIENLIYKACNLSEEEIKFIENQK